MSNNHLLEIPDHLLLDPSTSPSVGIRLLVAAKGQVWRDVLFGIFEAAFGDGDRKKNRERFKDVLKYCKRKGYLKVEDRMVIATPESWPKPRAGALAELRGAR